MKSIAVALFAAAVLSVPALADSSVVTDKPMVVAQGVDVGVGGVRVGDRDRDRDVEYRGRDRERDARRHHRDGDRDMIVIRKHRDRDYYGERRRD